MVEKRRGLGRGLGALIPSAPVDEVAPSPVEVDEVPVTPADTESEPRAVGRPADLFFERSADSAETEPRSYSSALRSGINKNVLEAQTKRVGKGPSRKTVSRETNIPEKDFGSASEAGFIQQRDNPSTVDRRRTPASDGITGLPADSIPVETRRVADPAPDVMGSTDSSPQSDVSRETELSEEVPSPNIGTASDALVDVPGATFAEIALDDIHPNRKQPRTEFDEDELSELVHSIREIGVLQPIVVRPSQEAGETPYELVMGERRWRASRDAGRATVPAIIRSTVDDDLLRDALLENLHRSALNPLEEAAAYQQLLDDFGCSHDELAGRLGRSRPQISNTLRLMKLPPLVQRRLAAGVLSAGHARALLGLEDAAEMEKLAQRIVAEGLSVRSTEEIVALRGGLRRATKSATPRDGARHERLDYIATSLSDRLDTSVKITLGAKKGRVSIEFASVDDLNRIISVLSPSSD